jgi:hypothetical protein
MIAFYLSILVVIFMVAYAGVEGTMRLFVYMDLELRYFVIKLRMWRMKKQLEKELGIPSKKFTEDYYNGRGD